MIFNERLMEKRKQAGLSQEELAARLGVSRQAVSKWETGAAQPELENIRRLCEVLNCTPNQLLSDLPDTPEPAPPISETRRQRWPLLVTAILCLLIGFLGGWLLTGTTVSRNHNTTDVFSVSEFYLDGQDSIDGSRVAEIRFIPSVSSREVTYFVNVSLPGGQTESYPAVYRDGTCVATVRLPFGTQPTVLTAHADDGHRIFAAPLCTVTGVDQQTITWK